MATTYSKTTTYTLAHTAQCKLQMAANRPDRNLRFLLGHAMMLDNLLVRIVEIEDSDSNPPPFATKSTSKETSQTHPQPPSSLSQSTTTAELNKSTSHIDDDAEDFDEEDEDEEEGMGLQRFQSASAQPPRMLADDSDSDPEDNEPISPPTLPADVDLTQVVAGDEDADQFSELYETIRHCPCHGMDKDAPQLEGGWKVDVKEIQVEDDDAGAGKIMPARQLAVMRVRA